MDTEQAERGKKRVGVFLLSGSEICSLPKIGSGKTSCFVCRQPGNPKSSAGYVVEQGNIYYFDQQEYVAVSPFSYKKNCLLYLPKTLRRYKRGSREEAEMVAKHIHSLVCSTYGHTLVLFTSYALMGNVYQILRDRSPFPMVEVWKHSQEEIMTLAAKYA